MRKKIESELKSLASEILKLNDFTDVEQLHQKSLELYEKLTLLKFVDNYFETRFESVEIAFSPSKVEVELNDDELDEPVIFEDEKERVVEGFTEVKNTIENPNHINIGLFNETDTFLNYPNKQLTLEEELENSIAADVAADLFEKSERIDNKPVSLNDKLQNGVIQVGLNDRIAFVKYLFNGSQEDYNRVLSQLNSFENESEAKDFLVHIVKPDYNWDDKLEYEQRFLFLIERKFL